MRNRIQIQLGVLIFIFLFLVSGSTVFGHHRSDHQGGPPTPTPTQSNQNPTATPQPTSPQATNTPQPTQSQRSTPTPRPSNSTPSPTPRSSSSQTPTPVKSNSNPTPTSGVQNNITSTNSTNKNDDKKNNSGEQQNNSVAGTTNNSISPTPPVLGTTIEKTQIQIQKSVSKAIAYPLSFFSRKQDKEFYKDFNLSNGDTKNLIISAFGLMTIGFLLLLHHFLKRRQLSQKNYTSIKNLFPVSSL